MASSVRLHYYDRRGEAEVLRLLFKVVNIKFEDKRYTEAEWEEAKSKFKIHDLPLIENVDGRLLTEPGAIARYFSLSRGLMGTSDWEYYMIEKCIENIDDSMNLLYDVVYNNVKLDDLQEFALGDMIKSLNKIGAQNGGADYLVGKTATLADVFLLVLMDYSEMRASKNYFVKVPKLLAIKSRMMTTYPEVGNWITTMRPITDM